MSSSSEVRVNIAGSGCSGAKPWTGEYSFHALSAIPLPVFEDKHTKALLEKWSVAQSMFVKRFRYDQFFSPLETGHENFVNSLLNSPAFKESMQFQDRNSNWVEASALDDIKSVQVPATVTNMTFFDRLFDAGIIRTSGSITKCLEETVDGVAVADELRKVLLMEDSEHYDIFSEEDRKEFIFEIFRLLVVGGAICQYEDTLSPYTETSKSIYKDLLRVAKTSGTNVLEVCSYVFKVTSSVPNLFPQENSFNRLFVIVEPLKRHATCWYFTRPSSWC